MFESLKKFKCWYLRENKFPQKYSYFPNNSEKILQGPEKTNFNQHFCFNSRWTSSSGFFQKNFNRRFTTKINSFAIVTQSAYYKHTSKKFQRVPALQAGLSTPEGPTPLPTSASPTSSGHLK
jgi:hypothetical protein